jgi:DHA2 family lincomycin resistance protein-like MFS transporter
MGGLRTELYPHGAAAFAAVQQLAGAAVGAVFISAYTIGSGARDAGVLSTAQAESAGHAAFLTAWAIGLLVLVGAFFVRRTTSPVAAAPISGEVVAR